MLNLTFILDFTNYGRWAFWCVNRSWLIDLLQNISYNGDIIVRFVGYRDKAQIENCELISVSDDFFVCSNGGVLNNAEIFKAISFTTNGYEGGKFCTPRNVLDALSIVYKRYLSKSHLVCLFAEHEFYPISSCDYDDLVSWCSSMTEDQGLILFAPNSFPYDTHFEKSCNLVTDTWK